MVALKALESFQVQQYAGLYTVSADMMIFMRKVERVAATRASILLRGQTGTGKELVARYIHQQSARAGKPFSAVNCAALSRELVASELFGHRKGAFTGAFNDRKGLLQISDGGTLFLDEVAELPLDIQAGLLRVFQDQRFSPLGSSEVLQTDLRVISATHTSLRRMVKQKSFREDLMYRLRVVPLYLPRLVEREGDIEMLSHLFLHQLNHQSDRRIRSISASAFDALLTYSWPGNIRELRNVMEYAHAIGEGARLEAEDLPPELLGQQPVDERNEEPFSEREQLLSLLRKHKGHKQKVADELGVSRATLWRKMKSMHIE